MQCWILLKRKNVSFDLRLLRESTGNISHHVIGKLVNVTHYFLVGCVFPHTVHTPADFVFFLFFCVKLTFGFALGGLTVGAPGLAQLGHRDARAKVEVGKNV